MPNVVVPVVTEAIRLSIVGFGLIVSIVGSDLQPTSPLQVDDGDKEEWSGSIGEGKGEGTLLLLFSLKEVESSSIDLLLFVRACSRLPRLSLGEVGEETVTTRLGLGFIGDAGEVEGFCCWEGTCEREGEVPCTTGSVF